jgi:hypothetical protein
MKKILMDGDVAIIDGVEFTTEEIKNAFVEQYKFHKLSDFIQTNFDNGGVSSE